MTENEKESLPKLTSKQKKHLKGLGHSLSPLILIGKEGMSKSLVEATRSELINHELIKVKVGQNSGITKHEAAETIPELTKSHLVQLIGKTLLLYKENPKRKKESKIILPRG